MNLTLNVDGNVRKISVNTDKPLNTILDTLVPSFAMNSKCLGSSCGNCLVLVNDVLTLSCLVPAFKLPGSFIVTFEGFMKSRLYHDIERAYAQTGSQPCGQCYASKTMIIGMLVERMEKLNNIEKNTSILVRSAQKVQTISRNEIARELAISSCQCIEVPEIEAIIKATYKFRSARNA